MDEYEIQGRIGEGAHGIVIKAKHLTTGHTVAIKKVALKKIEDGITCQMFREIKSLQELEHPHIIKLLDVFAHSCGFVLIFEFMVSDLRELINNYVHPITMPQQKAFMMQILRATDYMHSHHIIHRDLKPANLLINSSGVLKIADFGQARIFHVEQKRPYSHQVATRWYRAPELLYGARFYDSAVDIWAIGCIFAELINKSPLFPGDNDIEQIVCVFRSLGTPTTEEWPELEALPDYSKITFPTYPTRPLLELVPEANDDAIDLLSKFLVLNSNKRICARKALFHKYFMSRPFPLEPDEMPLPPKKIPEITDIQLDIDISKSIDTILPGLAK